MIELFENILTGESSLFTYCLLIFIGVADVFVFTKVFFNIAKKQEMKIVVTMPPEQKKQIQSQVTIFKTTSYFHVILGLALLGIGIFGLTHKF